MSFGSIQAGVKHSVNRLINGGFYRSVPRLREDQQTAVTSINLVVGNIPFSAFNSQNKTVVAPTIVISPERPKESLLAGWYCYGVNGLVDVRAADPDNQGVPIRSIFGPTPARFTFTSDGVLMVEQPVVEFWGLLDREITLSFYLKRGSGNVAVAVEVDYGTTKVQLLAVSTRSYQLEQTVRAVFTPPFDATQFIVRYKVTGVRNQSFYLGEAMLQLGNVPRAQFTDDITLLSTPRGACCFFDGFPAPPGYISQCDLDGRFIYPTSGDAHVDSLTRTNLGGSVQHRHGGKTSGDTNRTQVEKGGQSYISRTHRHNFDYAEVDPPWMKFLLVQKL